MMRRNLKCPRCQASAGETSATIRLQVIILVFIPCGPCIIVEVEVGALVDVVEVMVDMEVEEVVVVVVVVVVELELMLVVVFVVGVNMDLISPMC